MTAVRRKLEFQPVDGDIVVENKREAKTNRGRKLLEAMMVEKNLVQDTGRRMEVVGADVEALYPSLDAVQLAEIVNKAIMETDVGFIGINYAEGAKCIAMNSTAHECRISPLRRILPVRSRNKGVRPGVDPMGPEVGDQQQ